MRGKRKAVDKSKQKYHHGDMVYISNDKKLFEQSESHGDMMHFDRGVKAVVVGTDCDFFQNGEGVYQLVLLTEKDIPYDTVAWYHEEQLMPAPEGNRVKGLAILNSYKKEEYIKSCEYYGDCSVAFDYDNGERHVVRGKCLYGMEINWICPRMELWEEAHKSK